MTDQSVPQTILRHLETGAVEGYSSCVQALVAWAARDFKGHEDVHVKGLGSLKMSVHSSLFKGLVRIEAKPNMSTYDVFFENYNGKTGNLVVRAFIYGIKPEHLTQVIDNQLEGEYKDGPV